MATSSMRCGFSLISLRYCSFIASMLMRGLSRLILSLSIFKKLKFVRRAGIEPTAENPLTTMKNEKLTKINRTNKTIMTSASPCLRV